MVEGGTLLRCYTSQRGIEGSNPSSSAPDVPRLQVRREDEAQGRACSRALLHQRSQNALIAATNAASGIVNLYSRPPGVVVVFAAQTGLAQRSGASVTAYSGFQ